MSERSASARWNGGLKAGNGTMKIPRGNIEAPYSFPSRFEEGAGLSPEDLIAAAHAGCFSMAFSATLENAGFTPDSVETTAKVTLDLGPGGGLVVDADVVADPVKRARLAENLEYLARFLRTPSQKK